MVQITMLWEIVRIAQIGNSSTVKLMVEPFPIFANHVLIDSNYFLFLQIMF